MADLTILMLTPNRVPKQWAEFHKRKLLEAAGDNPIIIISNEPLDWGAKNFIQTEYGFTNILRQMLREAKAATTPFIAMADDDTLYPKEHFAFRPKEEGFYYNLNRWHTFTWGDPFYFHKPRPGNGFFMGSRELMIRALEARFKEENEDELPAHLRGELGTIYSARECDLKEWQPFYTTEPVLSFYHDWSWDRACRRHIKRAWPVRAYDIPIWGKAEEIREKFK